VRTLTELRHTPASPSLLRKTTGQQQGHNNPSSIIQHNAVLQITRSSVERSCSAARSSSQERGSVSAQTTNVASGSTVSQTGQATSQGQGPGGVGQGFMAVLNAKLIGTMSGNATVGVNMSPKSLRKQQLLEQQQQQQQQQSKNVKTAAPGFLETLNAKLAQQQQALQQAGNTSKSASIRRIMGNRVPIMDPLQMRDSLMDQIRRGTPLRKTSGPINDRSAPKIY